MASTNKIYFDLEELQTGVFTKSSTTVESTLIPSTESCYVDLSDPALRAAAKTYIDIAVKLQKLAARKKYKKILSVLDEIRIRDEGTLSVKLGTAYEWNHESMLEIKLPNGKYVTDDNEEFWNYVSVTDSCMGAWQAYLLKHLWSYLPLFGHALYKRRWYIYTQEQLKQINEYAKLDYGEALDIDYNAYDVIPFVIKCEGFYKVGTCFWSNFIGLARDVVWVFVNKPIKFKWDEQLCDVLYEYESEICY